jgi:guanylate kinase
MNKVILVGKAASGKDHMRKVMEGRGFTYGISYTTRPPREGEIDGCDYYFMSKKDFEERIKSNFWYEWVEFNGWYYGTSYQQFKEQCNLFIMTPNGISHINPIDRKECTIIYLDIPINVRRKRLEEREMPGDSLERRIESDERDFANFTDFDIQINNHNF